MTSARRIAVVLLLCAVGAVPARAQVQDRDIDVNPVVSDRTSVAGTFSEDRRTMRAFAPNLLRNLGGVVSGDNLRPFAAGVGLTVAGSFFDGPTERYFAGQHRFDGLGNAGNRFGTAAFLVPVTGMLFASGRASHDATFRAFTYDITQALIVDMAWTGGLKLATQRRRPDGSSNLSFPSGHTSTAFAFATIANHHYGAKVGIPAFVAAGLIGTSRLETNAHHLSDVIAGAAVGYIVGRTVVHQDGDLRGERHHVTLTPAAPPSGSGVGLALSYTF